MNAKERMLAAAAGAALSGLLVAPGTAHAAPAPLGRPALTSVDVRSGDWIYVRYLAGSESRSTVRAAAWKALKREMARVDREVEAVRKRPGETLERDPETGRYRLKGKE